MKEKSGGSKANAHGGDERHRSLRGQNNSKMKTKMRRNMQRLGGSGLSLEAFANVKSGNNNYNPSLIKKQREFYKNAKFVRKYKKSLKLQEQSSEPTLATGVFEDENDSKDAAEAKQRNRKNKRKNPVSLKELYEKKHEEEEKARMEREVIIQAKQEERQKSEARRKASRENMLKRTKSGQPVMKYRIERLLETIQGSTS